MYLRPHCILDVSCIILKLYWIGILCSRTIRGNPRQHWQTWDLLRLTIKRFIGLCNDFLIRNPGYSIKPIRINGSVIESLFGHFKYNSWGNLSSVNYRNCVAKLVIADAANAKEEYRGVKCDHKGISVKKKYNRKWNILQSLWCSSSTCVCVHVCVHFEA